MNLSSLLIVVLALVWCLISGEFSLRQGLIGLLFGGILVLFTGWGKGRKVPLAELPRRLAYLIWLSVWLLPYHIVRANLQMAWWLLRHGKATNPGIVRVPAGKLTIAALGVEEQLITLAPGQLVVDYSADEKAIYVHLLDITEFEERGEASVTWMYGILKRVLS